MEDVSEESLLDYFYRTGGNSGKVKNADILKTYKPFIGHVDLELRAKYREEFKLIIDRVAVVKSDNGEKYLFLKKKYRQTLQERYVDHRGTPAVEKQASPARPRTTPAQWDMSESEPDEECMGSMGSNTLDPLEKEWIYSAACARVPDLSQLLRQDPSLAHKKTALHWAAKHGKEDMATLVANAGADINTKSLAVFGNGKLQGGYTPLHIAALHGHQHILNLLVGTYGAKENLRDYSGHFACHYLGVSESERPEEQSKRQCQAAQVREPNRNRKLSSLFQSKKKWGSAEELAPVEEERAAPQQLMVPAFRTRKFSR
ncbi:uncharacterized protein FYW47_001801 [Aplochiton taeniatus]